MHTRRHFLKESAMGLGALALGSFLGSCGNRIIIHQSITFDPAHPLPSEIATVSGKGKECYLFAYGGCAFPIGTIRLQTGADENGRTGLSEIFLEGKRFAFIRGVPKMMGPQAKFAQHGQSGAWVSEHMPHLSTIVDEISFLKAVTTDQFNHAPAQLMVHTGSPQNGQTKPGLMGNLRTGNRESKFARICSINKRR